MAFFAGLHKCPNSPKPPMAMLELLARAAGAGLVASDFAPGRGIFGVSRRGGAHGCPGVAGEGRDRFGHRQLILAGRRIDVVRLHEPQVFLPPRPPPLPHPYPPVPPPPP